MRGAAPRIASRRGSRRGLATALIVFVVAALAGCAGKRIEGGTFYSSKGYRVTLPGDSWIVDQRSGADLALRHVVLPAAMLVNAECGRSPEARTGDVLARHLFLGVRDRIVVEQGRTTVGGWPATHAVVDGRADAEGAATRIGAYVVKGERCVYDLVYVAPPGVFRLRQADFRRFVESFRAE